MNIITERVVSNEVFRKLFNKIKEDEPKFEKNQEFQTLKLNVKSLAEYFDKGTKEYKILKKYKNPNARLVIFNLPFGDVEAMKFFANTTTYAENHPANPTTIMSKTAGGVFMPPADKSTEVGYLVLNKNVVTIDTLRHEFTHYIDWLRDPNVRIKDIDVDEKYIDKIITNINNAITPQYFRHYSEKAEYTEILNDFLNAIHRIYEEDGYAKEMSAYDFAKMIVNDLKFDENDKSSADENADAYLEKIRNLPYFNSIREQPEFAQIIFWMMNHQHEANIRNHIFGIFQKYNDKNFSRTNSTRNSDEFSHLKKGVKSSFSQISDMIMLFKKHNVKTEDDARNLLSRLFEGKADKSQDDINEMAGYLFRMMQSKEQERNMEEMRRSFRKNGAIKKNSSDSERSKDALRNRSISNRHTLEGEDEYKKRKPASPEDEELSYYKTLIRNGMPDVEKYKKYLTERYGEKNANFTIDGYVEDYKRLRKKFGEI